MSWLDELMRTLQEFHKPWVSATDISLLTAGSELRSWLRERRSYEGRHKHGWRSVLVDFNWAAGKIGPNLGDIVQPELCDCVTASGELASKLDNLSTANFKSYLDNARADLAKQVDNLLVKITSSNARKGAWRDLVEGCKSDMTSQSRLAELRDLFREIMELSGYDLKRLSLNLIGVLSNEFLSVRSAQILVNEVEATQVAGRPRPGDSAGLTQDQQMLLCEKLISFSAAAKRHVVWLAFYNAYLVRRSIIGFGNCITFYDGHILKSILDSDRPAPAWFPSELLGEHGLFSPSNLPGEQDTVLVRVDLGHGSFSDPITVAKKQMDAIVALTDLRAAASPWRLMTGYLHVIDGKIRGMGAFRREHEKEAIMFSPYMDGTDEALAEMESDFAPHFPIQKLELAELVEAAHAWKGASRQEPLSAIVLHVRILELVASRVFDKPWQEYLDHFLAKAWVRSKLYGAICGMLYRGIFDHPSGLSPDQEKKFRELQLTIFNDKPGGGFDTDMIKGLDALPFLTAVYSVHEKSGREVIESARTLASPAAIAAKRNEFMDDWRIIRARLHRIRNALAHGGPVGAKSASTVHEYARKMASWGLQLNMQGELSGKGPRVVHEEFLRKSADWFDAIPTAKDVKTALFPP